MSIYRAARQIAAVSCATAALSPLAPAAAAQAAVPPPAAPTPIRLTLPAPVGPHPVGKTVLHLVDPTRREPWVPTHPVRELMVSIWYPATRDADRYPVAPYLPPASGAEFLAGLGLAPGQAVLPATHARTDAPSDGQGGRHPLVMYLTGKNAMRDNTAVIDEDLASHGYVVVTVDFPYDGDAVEFPDGHIVNAVPDAVRGDGQAMLAERVADTRFVLDQLAAASHGADPDAEHHPLPASLAQALDLRQVGLFGHSLGGVNVASSMYADPRFAAGMDIDGGAAGPVVSAGLDRPFLVVDGNKSSRATLPEYQSFWTRLRGWHRDLALTGSGHASFTDLEAFYPQLAPALSAVDPSALLQTFGTIAPDRALAWQQAYPRAFFDEALRDRQRPLVERPSRRFPEVVFVP